MNDEEKAIIIEVLCSQALADHLGDVRDAEKGLWGLLGAEEIPWDDPVWDKDSAWAVTRSRLERNGLALPSYLAGDEDDDD